MLNSVESRSGRESSHPVVVAGVRCKGAMIFLALVIGCGEGNGTAPPARMIRRSVTQNASANLDANGRFQFETGAHAPDEIDAITAKSLALAMWKEHAIFLESTITRDRGGAAPHTNQLQSCERAYYARSAYEAGAEAASTPLRKAAGAHWLVGLCYGGTEEVVIAVSANATDARLQGSLGRRANRGEANFFTMGVPVGTTIPFSPESVVDTCAQAFGARVSEVPVLTMRPVPNAPTVALWKVTLDRSVGVRVSRSGRLRSLNTVFVGVVNGWQRPGFAAARADTSDTGVDVVEDGGPGSSSKTRVSLRRKSDVPLTAELVVAEVR